ncbi:hypothetical protein I4F81_003986 [Pyropia yezoensis]|uniref:Uncharacterized protein n=1 Tax=Pyropia yezoensis TaxID=2788 RepID=A0ACC3BV54_PYRYE|nr:hypothetical protein I4F81_003986 [Neopyropia yezoensis]
MGGLRERLELLSTRERDWEGVKDQLADLERMSGLRLSDGAGEPTAAAWVFCAVLPVLAAAPGLSASYGCQKGSGFPAGGGGGDDG